MNYRELLSSLTPDIYERLKRAVELGKWPDGGKLSPEQRQTCMQAVIAYEREHLPPEEHTGFMASENSCKSSDDQTDQIDQPLKWR